MKTASEALYYPYTSIQSLEGLKAMALYFEKIHIINPIHAYVGDDRPNNTEMSVLEDREIIRYISPMELLYTYESTITEAIKGDLVNRRFLSVCGDAEAKYCIIYESKIPQELRSTIEKQSIKVHKELHLPKRMKIQGEGSMVLPIGLGESIMINHALKRLVG